MLGQKTSKLYSFPRNLIVRFLGIPDINARQKWDIVWPYLNNLSDNINFLDAGCNDGMWTLELGLRKPTWILDGIDINKQAIDKAIRYKDILGNANCNFTEGDFFKYSTDKKFDAVLSVSSAHYFNNQQQIELFERFSNWLSPGGLLIILAPRVKSEVPFNDKFEEFQWHNIFSKEQLTSLCNSAKLDIVNLLPVLDKNAVKAKQLDIILKRQKGLKKFFKYFKVSRLSKRGTKVSDDKSLMWLLIAKKNDNS